MRKFLKNDIFIKRCCRKGTGEKAKVTNVDTAGKTGTTQIVNGPSTGAKDSWFVGYTPDLVGAIWVGYDKTDSDHYVPGGSQITTTMFRDIMKKRTQIQLKKHSSYRSYLRLIIKTIDYNRRGKTKKRRREEKERRGTTTKTRATRVA